MNINGTMPSEAASGQNAVAVAAITPTVVNEFLKITAELTQRIDLSRKNILIATDNISEKFC